MGVAAELDPRPGGSFRLTVDDEHVVAGRYLEVERPHRVSLSWGWEGSEHVPPGSTTVEITLRAEGSETVFQLRHFGLPDAAARDDHAAGWAHYTLLLGRRLA